MRNKLVVALASVCTIYLAGCGQSGPRNHAEVVMDDQKSPIHIVKKGETLSSIAKKYHMSRAALIKINNLKKPYRLVVGQRLYISMPGSSETPAAFSDPAAIPMASNAPANTAEGIEISPIASSGAAGMDAADREGEHSSVKNLGETKENDVNSVSLPPEQPHQLNANSGKLKRPVVGNVIKKFSAGSGTQQNDGINIQAPKGTPVYASADGTVVHAGNTAQGFGNVVILKHPNNLLTVYAHLDEMKVAKKKEVKKGDQIGKVGTTGSVKQPQLHFEVREGSKPVDPEKLF